MNSSTEENGIHEAINYYAEGMRTGNVEILKKGFHQQAILCGYLGDEKIAAPIEGLYDWVSSNPAPAATGETFGCGSSREHAPWALLDFGFRCIIAPSFADIFYNNCFKNGILPVTLPDAQIDELFKRTEANEDYRLTVDLEQQTIVCGNRSYKFTIDPVRRMRLLNGWDDIALTESYRDRIAAFKARDQAERPWAVPRTNS